MAQTTPFTQAEVTDIRRFCGYPAVSSATFWYPIEIGAILNASLLTMSDSEQVIVRTVYLANLTTLEAAVLLAGDNIGTDVAAVWTRNRSEVGDRTGLFNRKRRELCGFIGTPPGPSLAGGANVVRC